jgi:hypothetical protein
MFSKKVVGMMLFGKERNRIFFGSACRSNLIAMAGLFLVGLLSLPAVASDKVIIKDLDDIDLGTWTGASELSEESKHCVAATDKYYSIVATGSGIGGAFRVSNGAAEIPYQVYYKEKQNANLIQLTAGSAVHNLKGKKIKKKTPYCKNGKQVVEVRMLGVDMAKVPAGAYSGTLSLMVTPQ